MNIRQAKIKDVVNIQQLINVSAQEGKLLPRSLSELYERLRDFLVAELDGKIIGSCALHIVWKDLAEIRSLVVANDMIKQGVGTKLLEAAINSAKELEINKIFVLTYNPGFFKTFGFELVDKSTLPHKIWGECIKCIHFPHCDEEALVYDVTAR
ncbi:MAG: N-acetyltransferase [bacterium]|nr:N-acetyltransferase [bacterium]